MASERYSFSLTTSAGFMPRPTRPRPRGPASLGAPVAESLHKLNSLACLIKSFIENGMTSWKGSTNPSGKLVQIEYALAAVAAGAPSVGIKDLEWFNVSESLSFAKHLKGKVVVLDFFTYCCINCMHLLPDLKDIENEYSVEDGLVVIGVHSAKFDNEKLSSNILAAVQRYNISHPVVNDVEASMWNKCNISCWPTLLLLGPHANPLIMLMGEGHKDDLHLYIRNALSYYKSNNEISNHSLPMKSSFQLLPELKGPLLFPGKITNYVDRDNNNVEKFAVSDTGNHRILIMTADGVILHEIGGTLGFRDGYFADAKFNSPQGVVFQNEHTLFVADTENHAIRKIDLKEMIVETIGGIGSQGIDRVGGNKGTSQVMSSPWDLCIFKTPDMDMSFHLPDEQVTEKDVLVIAMAGSHQLWALFLDEIVWWKFKRYAKDTCICIAGSGREENRNNMYPHAAAFAQPSGLALCKESKDLYIADSESSCIRRMSLNDGKVTPVVGGDRSPTNLFSFGDMDGKLHDAKLQHPLGVAMSNNHYELYVADTYNHKIKQINTATNTISTLHISYDENDKFRFTEPSGLCVNGDGTKLYVCDTNNHCIKVVNLSAGRIEPAVMKLELKSNRANRLPEFDPSVNSIISGRIFNVNLSGGKIVLSAKSLFSDGLSLTADAPQKWLVRMPNETWSCVPKCGCNVERIETVVSVPKTNVEYTQKFYIDYSFVVCKSNICLPKKFLLEFSVNFMENGPLQVYENVCLTVGSEVRLN